jgi:ribosomal protein S26
MGEWGKWWSGRGHDQNVKCVFCGRNVPKHKAVQVNSGGRLSRDIYEVAEVVSMGGVKSNACISCAKHRHLVKDGIHTSEKDKWTKQRAKDKREMDKVMVKVKEMERKEGVAKRAESKFPKAEEHKEPVKHEAPKVENKEPVKHEAPKVEHKKEAPKELPAAVSTPTENEA